MSAKVKARYQRYVRKDGTVAYVVDTRDAYGKHVRRAFDRIDDADEFYELMRRQKRRVKNGLDRLVDPKLLRVFADEWMKRRLEGKIVVYSTWVAEEQRMRRYIKPRLGHLQLHKIPTSLWEKTLNDICSEFKLSPATHDLLRSIAHKLYSDAIRLNHAQTNPIKPIPWRRDKKKVSWNVWRTDEECLRYLRAAAAHQSTWFYPVVALAIQTGPRLAELLPLRWDEDLDLDRGRCRLWRIYETASKSVQDRTKGKGERWIGINPSVLEVLKAYRASLPAFRARSGALAFGREDGGVQDPRRARKIHDIVCARAGVPRIRFHDLRHQYASLFAKRSGNQKVLQNLMGHATPEMTEHYTHIESEYLISHAGIVEFEPVRVNYGAPRVPQKGSSLKLVKGDNGDQGNENIG